MKYQHLSLLILAVVLFALGCGGSKEVKYNPRAISGVQEARAEVKTGSDGLTSEQRNVKERLKRDNLPGSVKHLYIFSAYSGQCLLYSTVREKVTSSGKRLSPTSVYAGRSYDGSYQYDSGIPITINGRTHLTGEVLQDDGTYGHSIDYLFWIDSRGAYHQHYLSGGQIVHVSDQPIAVKSVIVNVETHQKK